MSLNVRPSDDCRRHLSGRRNAWHVTERPPIRRLSPSSQRSTQRRTAGHGPAYWSLPSLTAERRVFARRTGARRFFQT